ncbi:hypothetical protein NM688_g644 [Phlebia brevispora]|uniref:Uncharacterized protein n=1 Tax=Phlebia brevispora TaxID=194682 RepID=A0ACC1TDF1_9APHY|nr:hypothetical protein NM688_g644 [Phlebia brevispora]
MNTTDPTIQYLSPSVPHSIQAPDDGLELLLVFTDGNFDERGTTLMLSDWLTRTPLEVVAKNFGVNASILGGIPQKDPYMYKRTVPPPTNIDKEVMRCPMGPIPMPHVFNIAKQEKVMASGGAGLASALIYIEPKVAVHPQWTRTCHGPRWLESKTFDFQLFNVPRFSHFNATQLLALIPPQTVADLLNISTEMVSSLKKEKQVIVA